MLQKQCSYKRVYHLSPGWHFYSKHSQASAAATVPALLVVYMNGHFLTGLKNKEKWSDYIT